MIAGLFKTDGQRGKAKAFESEGRWMVALCNKSNGVLTGFVSPYFDPDSFSKSVWEMSEIAAYGRAGREPEIYFDTEHAARCMADWWNDDDRSRSPYVSKTH